MLINLLKKIIVKIFTIIKLFILIKYFAKNKFLLIIL